MKKIDEKILCSWIDLVKFYHEKYSCFTEEELANTPFRLYNAFEEYTKGYKENPKTILNKKFYSEKNEYYISEDIIAQTNIPFTSMCSHHWAPFVGKAHFGYIPNDNGVVGLSKIARLIKCFSRRFQIQEQLANQIVNNFQEVIKSKGCIIILQARHMCTENRGVKVHNSPMIVSAVRGCFQTDETLENKFYNLINLGERK